jgi:hypothetical protein
MAQPSVGDSPADWCLLHAWPRELGVSLPPTHLHRGPFPSTLRRLRMNTKTVILAGPRIGSPCLVESGRSLAAAQASGVSPTNRQHLVAHESRVRSRGGRMASKPVPEMVAFSPSLSSFWSLWSLRCKRRKGQKGHKGRKGHKGTAPLPEMVALFTVPFVLLVSLVPSLQETEGTKGT